MKFRPVLINGVDLLILLIAVGTLVLIGVLLTIEDVELFLASNQGSGLEGEAITTSRSATFDLRRTRGVGLQAFSEDAAPDPSGSSDLSSEIRDIRILVSARDTRDIILHEGFLYVATEGGLLVYRPNGALAGHYTHINGLPCNRLTCFASWRGSLWIGSENGLVRLHDGAVTTYLPGVEDGERVTALLPEGERLLVGTYGAGLLSFNGTEFKSDFGRLPGADFDRVTVLAEWRGQIAVGSFERGLFIQRGAAFVRITPEHGLPDERISGLHAGKDLLVATVTGVCIVDERLDVTPWSRKTMAAAILRTKGSTLVGTLDGRFESYNAGRRRESITLGTRENPVLVNRLAAVDNRNWLLTSIGLHEITPDGLQPFGERPQVELSANFIASMVFDQTGKLWIGYFDSGIELLSPDLAPGGRYDDEACRTVKSLFFDEKEGAVYVGSSKGLTRIGPDGGRTSWTMKSGLISNEVNHVRRWGVEIVAATGGGLSFIRGREVRSIYAFHGLVNNKVFTLLPVGERLIAGTLGGISIIEGHNVIGAITPENSAMPIHWITALHDVDGSLLVGTYGEGLALRHPDGTWEELPRAAGGFEVNPNAVTGFGDLLLAGTLDRGLAVFHRKEGRWRFLRRGLGSPNVTALAQDERRLFIGTDNGIVVIDKKTLL